MAIHIELEELYFASKREREGMSSDEEEFNTIEEHDKKRLARVKDILHDIDTREIWNCHYLAFLYHHGDTVDDYAIAHSFAKKAVAMGSHVSKWLFAATLDRWLVAQGKPQRFGTQFHSIDGMKKLLPVDTTISDEERKKYGIPPLIDRQTLHS